MEWIPCSGRSRRDTKNKKNSSSSSSSSKKKNRVIVNQKPLDQTKPTSERLRDDYPFHVRGGSNNGGSGSITAQTFTFRELATATKHFRSECLLGEGGFGRVYKGYMESTNQVVAIKQLNRNGLQGNREFLVEVLMLSLLHHPNLVNLIGYCADGDQRLLVYEYMPLGSLEDHLLEISPGKKRLDWNTRMKIAAGAAKGLEHLHDKASPPVIYRDLKCSNILLGEGYHPKLSDFGLAKLGPVGDNTHVSTRVMGTYGYCAPEYAMTGQLTLKSDVYSFGVVLLEIITGRKAIDNSKATAEQNLVAWSAQSVTAQSGRLIRGFIDNVMPLREGVLSLIVLYEVKGNQSVIIVLPLIGSAMEVATHPADISVSRNKNQAEARPLFKDRNKFSDMADPMLQGQYPSRGLYQALAVAAMCVHEQPNMRPVIADVVTALTYLASQKYDPNAETGQRSRYPSASPPRTRRGGKNQ